MDAACRRGYDPAMRPVRFLLLTALLSGASARQGKDQALSVLYDPALPSATFSGVPAAARNVVAQGLQRLKTDLKPWCKGTPAARAYAVANGSFSRAAVREQVHLTEICGGLMMAVVTAEGRVLHATVFEPLGALVEGFAARDVNADGLSEVVLVTEYGDGGCASRQLMLLQFPAGKLRPLGELWVKLSCVVEMGPENRHDYRVYVRKGKAPAFIGVDRLRPGRLAQLTLKRVNLAPLGPP